MLPIAPFWKIVGDDEPPVQGGVEIVLGPAAAWGDGGHPTTQLCLQAIAALAPHPPAPGWRMLDFGSGSGILAIGAAKLGALVDAVEIDALAIETAEENAALNGVGDRIRYGGTLEGAPGPFDVVVANILRPVLIDSAEALVARLASRAALVLSGLLAAEVPEISVHYEALLGGAPPQVHRSGKWCALEWRLGG